MKKYVYSSDSRNAVSMFDAKPEFSKIRQTKIVETKKIVQLPP